MLASLLHFYSGQPLQNLSGVDTLKAGSARSWGFRPILVDIVTENEDAAAGEGIRTLNPNLGKVVR